MNKFKKLEKLHNEKKKLDELISDNLKTIKARFNDRQHKVIREGKEVMVKEKDLWEEIWHLGGDASVEAGKIMRKKYPDLFILVDKGSTLGEEIGNFTLVHFGFDHKAMTLSNYISLSKQLIRFEITKLDYIAKIILVQAVLVIIGFLIRGIF
jgi:hypothetical protein